MMNKYFGNVGENIVWGRPQSPVDSTVLIASNHEIMKSRERRIFIKKFHSVHIPINNKNEISKSRRCASLDLTRKCIRRVYLKNYSMCMRISNFKFPNFHLHPTPDCVDVLNV